MPARHLILDGYNLVHRARGGFQKGEWPIVFNFMRGLRPIIERFLPLSGAWIAFEGHPRRHLQLLPEYKGNRPGTDTEFTRQLGEIMALLRLMPIRMVMHPDHEADDTVASIIEHLEPGSEAVVVSSDSDFTQLLQLGRDVRVWNWRTTEFVRAPDHDYVRWKALRGDPTDNVPRCPGMTEAAALQVAKDDNHLALLVQDAEFRKAYERNLELIRLRPFDRDALFDSLLSLGCTTDWGKVKERLQALGFRSMTKDGTWDRYTATFDELRGGLRVELGG